MFDLRYLRINSKYYQWIGAFIGLYFGGIIGAIVVFFLVGKLVKLNSGGLTYELALLNLSILLIKSDGNVDSREIEYVRSFFVKNFGKERANFLFKEIKKKTAPSTIEENCKILFKRLNPVQFYSVIQFFYALSSSDGLISKVEDDFIKVIAVNLGLSDENLQAIRNQFVSSSNSRKGSNNEILKHLSILGLKKGATKEDIKDSYRNLAKEFHPDRLTGMSEGIIKLAKEKFQMINDSYVYLNKNYV